MALRRILSPLDSKTPETGEASNTPADPFSDLARELRRVAEAHLVGLDQGVVSNSIFRSFRSDNFVQLVENFDVPIGHKQPLNITAIYWAFNARRECT